MINFYDLVPSVYTKASRDFQYLSWLFNIVLNSVKHNVDDMCNIPHVGYDPKLSELLALTLGFKLKRNYDQEQLAALVEILPSVLRYKGTLKAVEVAANALISAAGSLGESLIELDNNTTLRVTLPEDLSIDITLFLDLLDYILPAGMTCRVIRANIAKRDLLTVVGYSDNLRYDLVDDLSWDSYDHSIGLATLFDPAHNDMGEFVANLVGPELEPNTGLFNNTVIPVLSEIELDTATLVTLMSTEIDGTNKMLCAENGTEDGTELLAKKSKRKY